MATVNPYGGFLPGDQTYPSGPGGSSDPWQGLTPVEDPGRIKKQPVPTYPQLAPGTTESGGWNGAATPSMNNGDIAGAYQTYLGRQGRPDEISQYQPAVQQYGWEAVKNQIANSPEAQAFKASGQPQYSGTNVFGNDPSTASFEQLLNKLTSSFATPQTPPAYGQAVNQLNTYLQQLNGPAYTPAQMDLLQTQATDPLMQRRDAARQQAIQRLASQGIPLSSGIAQDLLNQVDRSFDQQNTQQQGQFAANAVGLQRQNQATAAQLAPLISQFQQGQTQWQDQRNQQAATLASIIPQLAQSRLGAAQGTLANSPSVSQLLQLLNNFQTQGYAQGADYGQGIAQLLAALFAH